MPTTRRKFITSSLKAGLATGILSQSLLACSTESQTQSVEKWEAAAPKPLKILILGGTSFLGPHQVAYALSRGHSITTFTRGKTKPTIYADLFDQVTSLIGDRNDDLTALENGQWDAVIDNSGRRLAWAESSAKLLKDKANLYLYTSSTGVYYPYHDKGENIDETTTILTAEPEGIEDEDMKMEYWYGVMKGNSEQAVRNEFGDERTIAVRPTYMIGPADRMDRFTYWPLRMAQGGDVIVPGKANDPVQYIDVRDVAEWMIRLIEEKMTGTFNAVGPQAKQNVREFAQEAAKAFDTESNLVFIDDYQFLKDQNVPFLVPWIPSEGNNAGSALASNQKALANGLSIRPLTESMKDFYTWWNSGAVAPDRKEKFETDPESLLVRDQDVIAAWHKQQG
ncbi:MAG: NAD-dependent epimerase/dehydratase family protein [Bacteroidota bacterium]